MFCRICGKPTPNDSDYCTQCDADASNHLLDSDAGTNQALEMPDCSLSQTMTHPTPIRKKSRAAIVFAAVSVLLTASLILSFFGVLPSPFGTSATASGLAVASRSFDTPEKAIESFIGYLKTGDYDGALSTCAVRNMSSRIDFQKIAEYLQVISPMQPNSMPTQFDQYVKYNTYSNSFQLLNQIIKFKLYFTLSEDNRGFITGNPIPLEGGQFPSGLFDELDPSQSITLNIVEIDKAAMQDSDDMRKIQKESAALNGADDIQFRSVLYVMDGNYYIGGFTLISYDGKWQIQNMVDPLLTVTATGLPTPVSGKSEFEELLG